MLNEQLISKVINESLRKKIFSLISLYEIARESQKLEGNKYEMIKMNFQNSIQRLESNLDKKYSDSGICSTGNCVPSIYNCIIKKCCISKTVLTQIITSFQSVVIL